MWGPSSDAYANGDGGLGESGGQIGPEEMGVFEGEAKPSISEDKIPKMRSGLFLILHNVSSTVFLSSCAGEFFRQIFERSRTQLRRNDVCGHKQGFFSD